MSFYASYTGKYGIRFEPYNITTGTNAIRGNIEYNFTIRISSETPRDATNDQGSSQPLAVGVGSINTDVNVVWDMMDWYSISAPDPTFPTKLDMQVSLISPYPDFTSMGIYYGVELDLFIKYNTRSNPGTFRTETHRLSVGKVFQDSANCDPSPKDISIEKNCTEMYLGILIRSYGIDPTNPGGRTYQIMTEGRTTYSIIYDISANIPNRRPQLLDAGVDKSQGDSEDVFTFSVVYKDPQNESARIVELWKNDAPFKEMSPVITEGNDYVKGVRYETDVRGSQIGSDGIYKFNISGSDGKDWAVDPESGLRTFMVKIDNNQAPESTKEFENIETIEDTDPIWIVLDSYFDDWDMSKLTYTVFDEDRNEYLNTWKADNFTATVVNNGTEVQPEWRLVMDINENVNGEIHVIVNATDDGYFPKSAEMDFIFSIEAVNDPPVIKRVGGVPTELFKKADFSHLEQGELEEITIVAEDIDIEDVLTFTWNIGELLSKNTRGTDYDFDPDTGELWFYTTDDDVPGFETTITVSDGKGGMDEVLVVYDIENINDPPTIKVPSERSTIEGEYLYITPTFNDPDIDTGDIITFSYTMVGLDRVTPSSAIEFSQINGRLVIKAVNEEMNGEWEVNITVVDLQGEADWGICKVTINNVNDPPAAFPINVIQEDENLTVLFNTLEAEDEDENDILTYIWDFGDGSDPLTGVDLRNAEHTFPTAGAYTVTLTVSDGRLNSEVREIILTVTAPPPDPDKDDDNILDDWELKYGLDPTDPSDAELDQDDDGLTNLEEFDHFIDTGLYLNPWNPDTDGDGFEDGEEVSKGYDPMDPFSHPEATVTFLDISVSLLNLLLWLIGLVLIVLMLLAAMVFIVLRIRNRPKPVASPTAVMPSYPQVPSTGYYEQMPPAEISALPPAADEYGQLYYPDQGQDLPSAPLEQYPQQGGMDQYGYYQAPVQEGYSQENLAGTSYDQFGVGTDQQPPQEEQYQSISMEPAQGYQDTAPLVEPPSEQIVEPVGQEPPQMDGSDQGEVQPPTGPAVVPESGGAVSDPQVPTQETEVPDQQQENDGPKEKEDELPSPPDLPDV
jgi:PKD repeat protein